MNTKTFLRPVENPLLLTPNSQQKKKPLKQQKHFGWDVDPQPGEVIVQTYSNTSWSDNALRLQESWV